MFGYIRINEAELRIRELDLYRSYYCGLCEDLLSYHGRLSQLTLNYDTTFLALLLTSLYEPADESRGEGRCIAHPLKKHSFSRNAYTKYAADMTVLLAWYSSRDDWEDERKFRGLVVSGALRGAFDTVCAGHPEKAAHTARCLERLRELEKQGEGATADETGACFGGLLAEIFAYEEDAWAPALRHMGFYLGKYIYLLDAYDDLDKDAETGSFNPLLPVRKRMVESGDDFDGYMRSLLNMLMASCCRAFEALPIVENVDILRNILYSGVWTKFEEIYAKRTGTGADAGSSPDEDPGPADGEDAVPSAEEDPGPETEPGEGPGQSRETTV